MAEVVFSLESLLKNLRHLEKRIEFACQKVQRNRKEITLVAITKSLSSEPFSLLAQTPLQDIGENYVPQLLERIKEQTRRFQWHFVGHLQSNKIPSLPPLQLIHSVDSEKLLHKLDAHYQKKGYCQEVLLQLNITQEPSKHGFSPENAFQLLKQSLDFQAVRVLGLMTMAKLSESAEESREPFRKLKQYFEEWKSLKQSWLDLKYLSMGMSQDFEVAIEEGATHLRVGSVLFQTGLVSQ